MTHSKEEYFENSLLKLASLAIINRLMDEFNWRKHFESDDWEQARNVLWQFMVTQYGELESYKLVARQTEKILREILNRPEKA